MAAITARSNAAAMRQSKLVGEEGIGPTGRLGGLGGSSKPMPVNLRGGPRRALTKLVAPTPVRIQRNRAA